MSTTPSGALPSRAGARRALAALVALALVAACDSKQECSVGEEQCACTSGGACNPGLTCMGGVCQGSGSTGAAAGDTAGGGAGAPSGLAPECPASELGTVATASVKVDLSGGKATKGMSIQTSGDQITKINLESCTLVTAETFTSAPCNDQYECGGCKLLVRRNDEGTWLMDLTSPKDGSCDRFNALYELKKTGSGSGGSSCPKGCTNPYGSSCCQPPFCAGDCVGSPCCN